MENMNSTTRYNEDFIKILGELYTIMSRQGETISSQSISKSTRIYYDIY